MTDDAKRTAFEKYARLREQADEGWKGLNQIGRVDVPYDDERHLRFVPEARSREYGEKYNKLAKVEKERDDAYRDYLKVAVPGWLFISR
jgi:hypothetical protein